MSRARERTGRQLHQHSTGKRGTRKQQQQEQQQQEHHGSNRAAVTQAAAAARGEAATGEAAIAVWGAAALSECTPPCPPTSPSRGSVMWAILHLPTHYHQSHVVCAFPPAPAHDTCFPLRHSFIRCLGPHRVGSHLCACSASSAPPTCLCTWIEVGGECGKCGGGKGTGVGRCGRRECCGRGARFHVSALTTQAFCDNNLFVYLYKGCRKEAGVAGVAGVRACGRCGVWFAGSLPSLASTLPLPLPWFPVSGLHTQA